MQYKYSHQHLKLGSLPFGLRNPGKLSLTNRLDFVLIFLCADCRVGPFLHCFAIPINPDLTSHIVSASLAYCASWIMSQRLLIHLYGEHQASHVDDQH